MIKDLPGVLSTRHINSWNMDGAPDNIVMNRLFEFARDHQKVFCIFFTRDIRFLKDAGVTPNGLIGTNVVVIILQEYFNTFNNKMTNNWAIGNGDRIFLQKIMQDAYYYWYEQYQSSLS